MAKRRAQPAKAASAATRRAPGVRWIRWRWQAAAIVALVFAAYMNSLDGSFHFDDFALLTDPFVTASNFGLAIFRLSQSRPLTYWTFHLNYLAGGASPLGYHLVNIAVHALNSVLVLWVAGHVFGLSSAPGQADAQASTPATRRAAALGALFGAGVFALHPIQTEAVTYIFERASLLATLFALVSLALFIRGRLAWSALAFAVSLLSKEEALAFPALVLLYDYLFVCARDRRRLAKRWWYYAILLALDVLAAFRLLWLISSTHAARVGFAIHGLSAREYALTQARVVWRYLMLLVLPVGQNLDYDLRPSTSLVHPATTLFALLALVALVSALVLLGRRRGPAATAAFWLLGSLLLLSPSSSIVPQADLIFEHRMYLPMAGIAVAIAFVFAVLAARARTLTRPALLGACVLAALLALTVVRNEVWANELTLWTDVTRKSPNKARSYIGLWRGLNEDQRPAEARQALERGLAADPNDPEVNANLGVALLQAGRPQEAYAHFERALAAGGPSADTLNNLGAALYKMGRKQEAIADFRRAVALDPCSYNARRNLAMSLATDGERQQALDAAKIPSRCHLLAPQQEELERYASQIK